ncbi:MAG: helicase [Candidatus Handelsmanbacteria bacterium RIFCSPLOWO2_12_FULL_64_10]|uniref:Helicase n=1 Tax=Handelsmanbacteria sp. (strain RIFCSPLOWO2_12_FULL_64_10) TaxID=1817868 RepID=A0A1F6C2G0_HANXR|nr:MAG: helicase [Candidatus Handelsmanbacteria bacterium RIFCSPLOWO2_12_FULL_64_10]
MNPGSIVRCRNRDWVLLPSDSSEVHLLRPLTGATDEVVAIHKRLTDLLGYDLPEERVRSATFPLPTVDDLADAGSAHLLWQAARLTLREGATPFRSLGRISIRPRIYQFVPLLMALRLEPVRMLIADDVGVGKTIEALLVAREMMERGEVKRLCVLCPPYLCEQWQKELSEKFNLDAVVIRSGTVSQLERRKPSSESIYRHYPIQVASIDFLKTDRNRHLFLLGCPDMVIVDEAHGATVASDSNLSQQQRHQLVREIAGRDDCHLILLTATPHSGIESAFRSLLAQLRPEFGDWDTAALAEPQRIELARHFVQRTRRDIEHDWEGEYCFPKRDPSDETYRLSRAYQNLFNKTYDFCSEMVRSGQTLDKRRQRVRYWGALALLRCVMSSPAAAVAALETRHDALASSEDEPDFRPFIFESSEDRTADDPPTPPVESAEATLAEVDRRRLRELGRLAKSLLNTLEDTKLARCAELVADLLRQGFHPIVWCRFIATADYLAEGLRRMLQRTYPDLRVVSITGRLSDDERQTKVEELAQEPRRILVATDCLSEGTNLQHAFTAVLHYDLPWNPNRLEQREGRVDRYGQTAEVVKAIRYFSPDSAVDGVVIDVLLNKAREIHRSLGTHVPVPEESETVTEAVLNALFLRGRRVESDQLQLDLGFEVPRQIKGLHARWDQSAERERINRTRFAQRALNPEEVRQELEVTDAVLGDPDAVREFVLSAAQRLGLSIARHRRPNVYRVAVGPEATATLPAAIAFTLPAVKGGQWLISFTSPTPEGAEYLGRNHRFVAALARFLMEEALTKGGEARASRCGVVRTRAVSRLSTILLLRVRYLLHQPDRSSLLSEEVHVTGFTGGAAHCAPDWLSDEEALRLLAEARPDANVAMAEKQELIGNALGEWPGLESNLHERIHARAAELEKSHRRVRRAVALRVRQLTVTPQLPPDLLGILVLQPMV